MEWHYFNHSLLQIHKIGVLQVLSSYQNGKQLTPPPSLIPSTCIITSIHYQYHQNISHAHNKKLPNNNFNSKFSLFMPVPLPCLELIPSCHRIWSLIKLGIRESGNPFLLKVQKKWKMNTCFQRWILDIIPSKRFLTLFFFSWTKCLNFLLFVKLYIFFLIYFYLERVFTISCGAWIFLFISRICCIKTNVSQQ